MMNSIRSKLFATYAALVLFAVILLGAGFSWFIRGFYVDSLRERLAEEARVTGELLKPYLVGTPAQQDIAEMNRRITMLGRQTTVRITLVAPDGVVLGDSAENALQMDNHLNRPEIRDARVLGTGSSIRFSNTVNEDMLFVAVPLEEDAQLMGYLRVALPLAQLNSALRNIQLGLVTGLFVVLVLLLVFNRKLSGTLTRPLEQMTDVAGRISAGELGSRIYLPNRDELGILAKAVNQMAESLEEQMQQVMDHRDQLKTILSTMVEGIIVFDAGGQALLANPAAENMLSLEQKGWQGKRALEIVRNPALHEKILKVSEDKVYLEHEIITHFPCKSVLSVTLAPISVATAADAGVLAVFHDITRLRKLEEMRADFAANVSHELRTPLTAIQGFAETLLDGAYSEAESARRFAEVIYREACRLSTLIEDVLKLSQIESGQASIERQPVAVADLVNEVLARLGDKVRNHKLCTELPFDLPHLTGDKGLLAQALFNLLDNAIKYTHTGGMIKISARVENGYIRLQVADNGIGIPTEAKERIFERFYRVDRARSRRQGGTGLGLAIVKHIVETHSGRLELTGAEGKGTIVALLLPVYKK